MINTDDLSKESIDDNTPHYNKLKDDNQRLTMEIKLLRSELLYKDEVIKNLRDNSKIKDINKFDKKMIFEARLLN